MSKVQHRSGGATRSRVRARALRLVAEDRPVYSVDFEPRGAVARWRWVVWSAARDLGMRDADDVRNARDAIAGGVAADEQEAIALALGHAPGAVRISRSFAHASWLRRLYAARDGYVARDAQQLRRALFEAARFAAQLAEQLPPADPGLLSSAGLVVRRVALAVLEEDTKSLDALACATSTVAALRSESRTVDLDDWLLAGARAAVATPPTAQVIDLAEARRRRKAR